MSFLKPLRHAPKPPPEITQGAVLLRARAKPAEIAKQLGVSVQAARAWFSGRGRPTWERCCELQSRYGVPASSWNYLAGNSAGNSNSSTTARG